MFFDGALADGGGLQLVFADGEPDPASREKLFGRRWREYTDALLDQVERPLPPWDGRVKETVSVKASSLVKLLKMSLKDYEAELEFRLMIQTACPRRRCSGYLLGFVRSMKAILRLAERKR